MAASLLRRHIAYKTLSSAVWYRQSGKTNTCVEGRTTSEGNRNYSLYNHCQEHKELFQLFFLYSNSVGFFFNYASFPNRHIIFLPIAHTFLRAVLTERSAAALHPALMKVPRIVATTCIMIVHVSLSIRFLMF